MKANGLLPNPRYREFHKTLAAHPESFAPWSGTLFRFQSINYPKASDILSGSEAQQRGGRWSPPGLRALYGSSTDTTALEECKANDRYYGILTKSPRILVAIEARLIRVLDLRNPTLRRHLGITLKEISAEDWRKLLWAHQESQSQALGRAAAELGASGLLVHSVAVTHGTNVVVFPHAHIEDQLRVVEGDKLARLKR